MTRRHLTFECSGDTLAASMDEAPGRTGLLIVTGGNETRAGAYSGHAQMAERIAAAGHPVFRFDRAGVGDSTGENRQFRESGNDIAGSLAAFRSECENLDRVVGFGNCDGASALMLSAGQGFDALVLANPWTIEQDDGAPPPEAIRSRYAQKLKSPRELLRLISGGVSLTKLAKGLVSATRPSPPPTTLAQEIKAGLTEFRGPSRILLAANDRTAQAFEAAWDRSDPRISRCENAGHSFAEAHASEWLFTQLLAALKQTALQDE